jgi:ribosome-dependent ATPase
LRGIGYLEEGTGSRGVATMREPAAAAEVTAGVSGAERAPSGALSFSLRRLFACTIRETLELVRDPIRSALRCSVRHF